MIRMPSIFGLSSGFIFLFGIIKTGSFQKHKHLELPEEKGL